MGRLLAGMALSILAGCATQSPPPNTMSSEPTVVLASPGTPNDTTATQAPPPIENSATGLRPPTDFGPKPDLWVRIRKGFAIPDLDDDTVREQERWYASRPDYIQRMTERSRMYLYHIVEEVERRNMPTELALLPFIESAFNPRAVSSAKAAGMWQFIPSTGKVFSLKQNTFMDERRDVLASTRAALDYLERLHDMFGDWQLALAAYNWGEGSVQRAIRKNQARGLGIQYTDLKMPNETRQYFPKLQAVKNIILQPDHYSAPLPSIADHPYFQTVSLDRDIDVALAAKLSNVNLDDFVALNPSAKKPVLIASATPQILLPWDNASVFQNNLESYDQQLASWTAWRAPRNMKPADAAKAVGMSESELRRVNQIPPRMLVKSGSILLVRRSAKQADVDIPEHVAENGQTVLLPEYVPGRKGIARARKGDSVHSLSRRLGVTSTQLAGWNQLEPGDLLKPGQRLVYYTRSKSAGKKVASGSKSRQSRTVPQRKRRR